MRSQVRRIEQVAEHLAHAPLSWHATVRKSAGTAMLWIAFAGVLGHAGFADAATRTWSGASGSNWNTPGNWVEGIVPVNGDDLVFPDNPVNRTSNNDIAGLSIASVSITTTNSGADYDFTGSGITLNGGLTFANPNSGGNGNPNWNIPLTLGVPLTITSSGRVSNIGASIALGANTLTFAANGDIYVDGVISGGGGLVKNGSSALTLAGGNDYTGATQSNGGALYVANATALGSSVTGTTFADGANLGTTGGPFVVSEPLVFSGPNNSVFGYGQVDLGGPLSFAGALTWNAYDPATIFGAITSTGTLAIAQSDSLTLDAASPAFTGTVSIPIGGVIVTGTFPAAVALSASGALYGNGTTGPVTQIGGTFAPGIALTQVFRPAGLAVSGGQVNLTLVPGAPVTNYDQVQVTGTVALGGTLNPTSAGPLPLGLVFVIIANDGADPVLGTFAGRPEGATFFAFNNWLTITYAGGDGNDVVLTTVAAPAPAPTVPVPGPGPLALALGALALVLVAARRFR